MRSCPKSSGRGQPPAAPKARLEFGRANTEDSDRGDSVRFGPMARRKPQRYPMASRGVCNAAIESESRHHVSGLLCCRIGACALACSVPARRRLRLPARVTGHAVGTDRAAVSGRAALRLSSDGCPHSVSARVSRHRASLAQRQLQCHRAAGASSAFGPNVAAHRVRE